MTDPGRMMRSQPIASRAVKPLCRIRYSAISVPIRPSPARQCTTTAPRASATAQEGGRDGVGRGRAVRELQVQVAEAARLGGGGVAAHLVESHHQLHAHVQQDLGVVLGAEGARPVGAVGVLVAPPSQVHGPLQRDELARPHLVQVAVGWQS